MAHTINQQKVIIESKPSIFRDACIGFLTSIGVGLLASILFVLIVLFLSSNALALTTHSAGAHLYIDHNVNKVENNVLSQVSGNVAEFVRLQRLGAYVNAPVAGTTSLVLADSVLNCARTVRPLDNFESHSQETTAYVSRAENAVAGNMYRLGGSRTVQGDVAKFQLQGQVYRLNDFVLTLTPRFVPDASTVLKSISSPDDRAVDVFQEHFFSRTVI